MSSRETTPLPHEGDASRPGAFLVERTSDAEEAMDRFARAGVHVVRSTDPMASWPGMG